MALLAITSPAGEVVRSAGEVALRASQVALSKQPANFMERTIVPPQPTHTVVCVLIRLNAHLL